MPLAVVVAQLTEWLLPIPQVFNSNLVIGTRASIWYYWKDENKEKEVR